MGGRRAADQGLGWAGLVDVEPDSEAPANLDDATEVDAPAGHDAALAALVEADEPDTLPQNASAALLTGLVLPSPDAQARPTLPPPPKVPAVRGFSAGKLVEQLEARPVEPTTSWWREYREVLLTLVVGAAVLAGYLALRGPAEPPAEEPAVSRTVAQQRLEALERSRAGGFPTTSETPAPPEAPAPSLVAPPAPPAVEKPPEIRPASTPMLSVLSTPAGAAVEIDGQPAGKTPLIGPSPARERALQLKLTHPDCKPWEQALLPDDGGHYTVRVELLPLRGVRP